MEDNQGKERAEIYSERVRAGKRTYFFDVKSTRSNDYYLTITESRRRYKDDGYYYEKHKVFLYKEDFEKFADGLAEVIEFIREANPQMTEPEDVPTRERDHSEEEEVTVGSRDYTSVEFEDLDDSNA